jgi:hypothetical protein
LSSPMDFGDTRKSQEIKELQGALVQNMYHFATLFSEKPVLVALARPTQQPPGRLGIGNGPTAAQQRKEGPFPAQETALYAEFCRNI